MDYEQLYKDALKRARKYKEKGYMMINAVLDNIFPELKEPEDELTWLTKYIEEEAYNLSIDIRDDEDRIKLKKLQKAFVWLEKQASKTKWSEEDDYNVQCYIAKAERDIANGCHGRNKELIEWLKSLKDRVQLQSHPTEWNEDDERIRKGLIENFKWFCGDFYETTKWGKDDDMLVRDIITWLEKQGKRIADCPQNHQDSSRPNGAIVLEDFNGGEGHYKVHLDYLNKEQVEEIENIVDGWNKIEPRFKVGD